MAFTRYTGNVTGQVGSVITALDAALVSGKGWSKAYSGTNKAIYRQAAGNQLYLRVNDNGAGTGGAKEALVKGCESASDVDTVTNPFPTASQITLTENSLTFRKSASVDATNRPYVLYADDRTFIFAIKSESNDYYMGPWYFGDIYSLAANDGWRTMLIAKPVENGSSGEYFGVIDSLLTDSALPGHFIARSYLGGPTAVPTGRLNGYRLHETNPMRGMTLGPNPADGGIYFTRNWITEYTASQWVLRGRLRGIWCHAHSNFPYVDGDTVSSIANLPGKTFQFVGPMWQANSLNYLCIETSNTLETN